MPRRSGVRGRLRAVPTSGRSGVRRDGEPVPYGFVISSAAINPSPVSQRGTTGRGTRPLRICHFERSEKSVPRVTAGNDGTGNPSPTSGKRFEFVIASQCADWSWQSVPPSPFPMFSNRNLKTPPFSIFNFQFSIRPPRAACGEQCSPLRTGCSGRGAWPADCRRYRRVRAGVRRTAESRPYGRGVRGTAGRGTRPLRRKTFRICHCETSPQTGRGNP